MTSNLAPKASHPRKPHGCLRRLSGGPRPDLRLICFPWAGAGASVYRRILLELPSSIECLAVQYPAREDRFRDPPASRMADLVAQASEAIALETDLPLAFFGHSMGALVAFETARVLEAAGSAPLALLMASGSGSPHRETGSQRPPSTAGDDEFIRDIVQMGGTPREVMADVGLVKALLPAIRSDYAVLETYVGSAASPLSCPIVACAGEEDPSVSPESLHDWSRFTSAEFKTHWFPGDHFYLRTFSLAVTRHVQFWTATHAPRLTSSVNHLAE